MSDRRELIEHDRLEAILPGNPVLHGLLAELLEYLHLARDLDEGGTCLFHPLLCLFDGLATGTFTGVQVGLEALSIEKEGNLHASIRRHGPQIVVEGFPFAGHRGQTRFLLRQDILGEAQQAGVLVLTALLEVEDHLQAKSKAASHPEDAFPLLSR